MKLLPISNGLFSKVDDDVFAWASKETWSAQKRKHGFHVARYRNKKYVYLHNLILGVKGVDHINGDGLDNQRHNLRPADKSQNGMAFQTPREGKTSKYRGVYLPARRIGKLNPWHARIGLRGRRIIFLGCFESEEAAARAYDTAAIKHFGEFAQLNFPA